MRSHPSITRKQILFCTIFFSLGTPLVIVLINAYHTEDIIHNSQTQLINVRSLTEDIAFRSLSTKDSKQISQVIVDLEIIKNNFNQMEENLRSIPNGNIAQNSKFQDTFTSIHNQYISYKTSIDLIEKNNDPDNTNGFSTFYSSVNSFVNSQNNLLDFLETMEIEIQNFIYPVAIVFVVVVVSACFYVIFTVAKWRTRSEISKLESQKLKLEKTRTLIETKYEELFRESEGLVKKQLEEHKQVEKQKDEFMSMITHELKTPLFSIEAYSELLSDSAFGNKLSDDQKESIEEIYKNSKNLERLIGDVLEAQKIEMQRLTFKKEYFHVSSFITDFAKCFKTIMDEKNIDFTILCKTDLMIYSDKERLNQVLRNIIINAIDFVPKGKGKIELGIKEQGDNVVFYVLDNGSGIPEEKQDNLFKKFYQIDTSIKRKHGGNGLGLVICKGIVEAMGGKIWVESQSGNGSTFYFTVPKTKTQIKVIESKL